jgi:hypothetical protein
MVLAMVQDQTNGGGAVVALLELLLAVVILAAMWRIFRKAGQPGWATLIPIYNTLVFLRVVGRPWWWLLLMLIPLVNWVIVVLLAQELAKSFGKGLGYTLGVLFLPFIFCPLLGFGRACYMGPAAAQVKTQGIKAEAHA